MFGWAYARLRLIISGPIKVRENASYGPTPKELIAPERFRILNSMGGSKPRVTNLDHQAKFSAPIYLEFNAVESLKLMGEQR